MRTKKIIYFVSKAGLDIEGFGEKNVQRFIDEGLVEDILDIFDLRIFDIAPLPGFGERSATNIVAAINKARQVPLWRLINALGITYIGRQTALLIHEWLIKKFGNLKNPQVLLSRWLTLTPQDLAQIPGIGPKASQSFVDFVRKAAHRNLLLGLAQRGMRFMYKQVGLLPLAGKTFLFTGSLATMPRAQAEKKVMELGGTIAGAVSKNLDYLVVGKNVGSKLDKAAKLQVKILTEEEFSKLLERVDKK